MTSPKLLSHRPFGKAFAFLFTMVFALGGFVFTQRAEAQNADAQNVNAQSTGTESGSQVDVAGAEKDPASFDAYWFRNEDGNAATLVVSAQMTGHWYIYSVTQPKGGPLPTVIKVASPDSVELTSDFKPDQEPSVSESVAFPGVQVEEHDGSVSWSASIRVPESFHSDIAVEISAQVCRPIIHKGGCVPIEQQLIAKQKDASDLKASQDESLASQSTASSKTTSRELTKQLGGRVDVLALMDEDEPANQTVTQAQTVPARKPTSLRTKPPSKSLLPTKNLFPGSGLFPGGSLEDNLGGGLDRMQPQGQDSTTMVADPVPVADTKDAYRDEDYVVAWKASVEPDQVPVGGTTVLKFTAIPDATYHVYEAVVDDADFSTNFVVTEKSGLKIGKPQANEEPIRKVFIETMPEIGYHKSTVTWSLPVSIPKDVTPGIKKIEGMIAYQACTDTSCQLPNALKFVAEVKVGDGGAAATAVVFEKAKSGVVLDAAAETQWVDETGIEVEQKVKSTVPDNLLYILFSAFVGGIILNFMPCVLPVIGLKVMSFVTQAGEDKKRILHLNLAYAAGISFVFVLLAILAIVFRFGWGTQFQYFSVRLGAIIGLFAFALSYFDVWEIPIPGFASGNTSQGMQSQEGFAGAFSKGIFTTLLATPCSGPFLGAVFGATLIMPWYLTALVFGLMAVGMSFPYILLGLRPELISYLPKPGPWMETFKQLMAFVFLGGVCYFFYQFADSDKLSVFVTLIGVWFGLWIIGKVPSWEPLRKRAIAWFSGIAAATAIGIFAFTTLSANHKLDWVEYSETALASYQAEGKTVMVEFSATWCPTCIYNMEYAIDTDATRVAVEELDVVPMYADWSDNNPTIARKLEELESASIPLLAIYPAGRADDPIVLRDVVTQQTVLDALRDAGPSKQANTFLPNSSESSVAVR